LAARFGSAWVAVDGYIFREPYFAALKSNRLKVLAVDDYGAAGICDVDIVLNQNPFAEPSMYGGQTNCRRLLLGSKYALLRREFSSYPVRRREHPAIGKRILISMGGSDPNGITLIALEAIRSVDIDDLQVKVIVGAGNPNAELIERMVSTTGDHVQVLSNVTDMPRWMAWADLAISSLGGTLWELQFMSVPFLLIPMGEDQRAFAEKLASLGLCAVTRTEETTRPSEISEKIKSLLVDWQWRKKVGEGGRAAVDGRGAARVLNAILENCGG
jgi:spore coat polysaccharide biosynthesis predicted glycosyltransferase SpsG